MTVGFLLLAGSFSHDHRILRGLWSLVLSYDTGLLRYVNAMSCLGRTRNTESYGKLYSILRIVMIPTLSPLTF